MIMDCDFRPNFQFISLVDNSNRRNSESALELFRSMRRASFIVRSEGRSSNQVQLHGGFGTLLPRLDSNMLFGLNNHLLNIISLFVIGIAL